MKNHIYTLKDGRIVFSEKNITYACRPDRHELDLSAINPEDLKSISIIANPRIADYLSILLENAPWEAAQAAMARTQHQTAGFHYQHLCIKADGKLYFLDGNYVPLEDYIKNVSLDELKLAFQQLAIQAAIAQIELCKRDQADRESKNKAELSK